MTNETPTEAAGQQNATAATFTVNAQYVKDLSFENPNIPGLLSLEAEPSVEMNIDVKGSNLNNDFYEVVLTLSCKGTSGETTLFVAELSYASLISLNDVPEEQIQRILFVECPILMFPFARNIIADATRDGGYPPISVSYTHLTLPTKRIV